MDLVIDVGNTRTKLAVFEGGRLKARCVLDSRDAEGILAYSRSVRPARIAWGSVGADGPDGVKKLKEIAPVLVITGSTPAPLRNAYDTPLTLGADRLANAVAGSACFRDRAVLVIDIGTCITYDLVDETGTYRGGAISPGARMRAQALHSYSARLPLVDLDDITVPFATNTLGALRAGIAHGILGECRAMIEHHRHQAPQGAVLLTGGDAPRFISALKSGIFAHPFLTLEGYRLILDHTAGGAVPGGLARPGPGARTSG